MSLSSLNPSAETSPIDPADAADLGRRPAHENPRILIVDDVADNRTILARRFQRRNYESVEAAGGISALELVAIDTYDAVLLDIIMPDLDGLEVLRRIRLGYSSDSLPVIMVSGKTQSADIVEAFDLGANDYIVKPIDFAVAVARVRAQVERKRASQALASANSELMQSTERLRNKILLLHRTCMAAKHPCQNAWNE
jgi:DNA-binding response OmpR family regulator